MDDPDYLAAAWDEYNAKKTGPLSYARANHIVFTSLADLDPTGFASIASMLGAQEPLAHLPAVYAENPSLL